MGIESVSIALTVLFFSVLQQGHCHPLSEEHPLDGTVAIKDVFDTTQEMGRVSRRVRSPDGASPQYWPPAAAPVYQSPSSVTEYPVVNNDGVRVNPWVVIHACWKPRPSILDIYRATAIALLNSGLGKPNMKEALAVVLAVVTLKENYNHKSSHYSSDGYSYHQTNPIKISYRNIKEVAVLAILQSSSLTHLAWLWSTAVWNHVKPNNVQNALCLTIAMELLLLRNQDDSRPFAVQPNKNKEHQTATVCREGQEYPGQNCKVAAVVPAIAAPPSAPSAPSKLTVSSATVGERKPLLLGVDLIVPPIGGLNGSTPFSSGKMMYGDDLFEGDITGGMGIVADSTTGQLTYAKGGVALDGIKEGADFKFWPNAKVFYEFHPSVRSEHRTMIQQAMQGISGVTCVTFSDRDGAPLKNFLIVRSDTSVCSSTVGMWVHGSQTLSLSYTDERTGHCMAIGVIQHEILHTLGFYHEHARSDRDNFIKILLDNLADPRRATNFEKRDGTNFRTPYDIRSIMHYELTAFAKPGTMTMEPIGKFAGIDPKEVGQRERLGEEDINMINRAYGCDKVTFQTSTSGDGARVQNGCDWVLNDIVGERSSVDQCGQKCKDRVDCTHFTWMSGVCNLKRGCPSFPFTKLGFDTMCGYMPDRVTVNAGCTRELENESSVGT